MDGINSGMNTSVIPGSVVATGSTAPMKSEDEKAVYSDKAAILEIKDKASQESEKVSTQKEREKTEKAANEIFEALNTGLVLKFHEKSGEWYAVIQNKITEEVVKEVPPKYVLDLHVRLKEMIGIFLDKKV